MANNVHNFSGGIKVGAFASDPGSADNGFIYYNTTSGSFRFYQNGAFTDATVSEVVDNVFAIVDQGDSSKKMQFEVSGISTGTTRQVTMPDFDVDLGLIDTAIQSSEKGAALGVATLDAGGLLPTSQLPPLAITSVFVVANQAARLALTAQEGDVAIQTDNSLTYILATNSPSTDADWKVITAAGSVTSVNGQTGTVSLDSDDIAEGSTNLYFTETRAKTATVSDTIADGVMDVAPSQNAVFDALALKLANVVEDTTPQLGGNLELNGQALLGLEKRAPVASPTQLIEEEYLGNATLAASQTNTTYTPFTFSTTTYHGIEVTYTILEATTNRLRMGRLRIVSNGTSDSIVDDNTQTADVGVTWACTSASNTCTVTYSSTANTKTLKADVKRFKI